MHGSLTRWFRHLRTNNLQKGWSSSKWHIYIYICISYPKWSLTLHGLLLLKGRRSTINNRLVRLPLNMDDHTVVPAVCNPLSQNNQKWPHCSQRSFLPTLVTSGDHLVLEYNTSDHGTCRHLKTVESTPQVSKHTNISGLQWTKLRQCRAAC